MNEVPSGLSPDAELRYHIVAHLLNTRLIYADAVPFAAEELVKYVKTGFVPDVKLAPGPTAQALDRHGLRAGVGTGVWTFGDPPVPQHDFSMAEAAIRAQQNADAARMYGAVIGRGQAHTIRQEDQSRG
ncbi:MAG: hypothetical protein IPK85_02250 [Gemmatimonadetes bacterium]|nr:hypothetical protein [Gemmatimonadota bacterium]